MSSKKCINSLESLASCATSINKSDQSITKKTKKSCRVKKHNSYSPKTYGHISPVSLKKNLKTEQTTPNVRRPMQTIQMQIKSNNRVKKDISKSLNSDHWIELVKDIDEKIKNIYKENMQLEKKIFDYNSKCDEKKKELEYVKEIAKNILQIKESICNS